MAVASVVILVLLTGCTTGPSTTTESPTSSETTGIQPTTSNTSSPDAGLSYRLKLVGETSNVTNFTLTLREKAEGENNTVLMENYSLASGETIDLSKEIRGQGTYHVSIKFENGNTSSARVFSKEGLILYIGDGKIDRREKEVI